MSASTPNPLRSIVYRLNITATSELPQYAGFLAASILQCAPILKDAKHRKDEISVTLHKLKTRVSALLQDKTAHARFSGLVLAKAIIDASGVDELSTLAPWARMLLSCLNKTDPAEVKKLGLITITRLFLLTVDQPALVREITTPVLPAFISTCLNMIRPVEITKTALGHQIQSPVLETVLRCWQYLIPEFASTFRPYISSLKTISLSLLSQESTPVRVRALVIDVLAILPLCSARNTAASEWENTYQQVIQSVHQLADVVFRSVNEDWSSNHAQSAAIGGKATGVVKTKTSDVFGMDRWTGMSAGANRMQILLQLLKSLITQGQAYSISCPVASVLDLTGRLANVTRPTSTSTLRNNIDISQDEREELWLCLSDIHISVLNLLRSLTSTYIQALRPLGYTITVQVLDMFESGRLNHQVRQACYEVMHELLRGHLLLLSQSDHAVLFALIKASCEDLGQTSTTEQISSHQGEDLKNLTDIDPKTGLMQRSRNNDRGVMSARPMLYKAARDLMPLILTQAADLLPSAIRADVDRTIILTSHREAMLASVLHPSKSKGGTKVTSSILPFVARVGSADPGLECLLRPRMPLIRPEVSAIKQLEVAADSEVEFVDENPNELDSADQTHAFSNDASAEIPQSSRKRDYALIDADTSLANGDVGGSVKKLRETSPQQESVKIYEPAPEAITVGSPRDTTPTNSNQDWIHALVSDRLESDRRRWAKNNAPVADQQEGSVAAVRSTRSAQWIETAGGDDSSDDGEIPKIDTTISDEEIEQEAE